jgi:anti-sigma-K factor RskA
MDYSRRDRADRLAAEYALGTLRGPARRRFEALLPAHPALRQALADWQHRLQPLATGVAETLPPPQVWQRIEARLFGSGAVAAAAAAAAAAGVPWWQKLALWRGLTGLATAAALALLVVGSQEPVAQAPVVIVLNANPDAAAALNASFVASISADGRALVLRPIQVQSLQPGRALELWAVPPQGAPRSLGLVQAEGATTLLRAQLLRDTAALAVSLEPAGGSPTGAPSGPVVSVGKLQI